MFNRDILKQLVPLMTRCTSQLLDKWQQIIDSGKAINITEATIHAALNFILSALFSEDLSRIIDETGENPFLMVTDESSRDLLFARRFRSLSTLIVNMIERREKEIRRPSDILSLVMDACEKSTGKPIPQKQQLDEVLTLIIAGHETTASALNWTWYLISKHPQVEQRLLEETEKVLHGRPPVFDDYNHLSYVEHCEYEVDLRHGSLLHQNKWTLVCLQMPTLKVYLCLPKA